MCYNLAIMDSESEFASPIFDGLRGREVLTDDSPPIDYLRLSKFLIDNAENIPLLGRSAYTEEPFIEINELNINQRVAVQTAENITLSSLRYELGNYINSIDTYTITEPVLSGQKSNPTVNDAYLPIPTEFLVPYFRGEPAVFEPPKPKRQERQAKAAQKRVELLKRPALLDAVRRAHSSAKDVVKAFRSIADQLQDSRTIKPAVLSRGAFNRKPDEHRTLTPFLAAIHSQKESRRIWQDGIDEAAKQDTDVLLSRLEKGPLKMGILVIGSGPNAAAFVSSLQAENPDQDILVLDRGRLGGQFASYGNEEIFDLNSRTRPSNWTASEVAGEAGNINPLGYNAVLQLPDITGKQYAGQNDIADAVRTNIILSSNVGVGIEVQAVSQDEVTGKITVFVRTIENPDKTYEINPSSVVLATGLGAHKQFDVEQALHEVNEESGFAPYMTSADFMKTLGTKKARGELFPLKGMKKVAVIGAGDSGKIVLEQLLGQSSVDIGPAQAGRVESVVWFGSDAESKQAYLQSSRARYAKIGAEINARGYSTVNQRVFTSSAKVRASDINRFGDKASIIGNTFDLVIDARGYDNAVYDLVDSPAFNDVANFLPNGRRLGQDIYVIGPAAELTFMQTRLAGIPENSASLFNYIPISERLGGELGRKAGNRNMRAEFI